MKFQIEYAPAFAWLRVHLEAGESIQAEAGAMVRRAPSLIMKTRLNAGRRTGFFGIVVAFMVALIRKLFGGETLFVNEFAGPDGGEVVLAPVLSGQVMRQALAPGRSLFVQSGSYLASTGDIDTRVRWGGLRTLFGGEGLVLLECSGTGDLFVNSYGGITPVVVDGSYVVDTGHIVAFDSSLDFRVRSVGGIKAFFFSGEGLVCEFTGRGMLYMQSRNLGSLVSWISPTLHG
jgi:uncharacterized protein (TIGR00266 family)